MFRNSLSLIVKRFSVLLKVDFTSRNNNFLPTQTSPKSSRKKTAVMKIMRLNSASISVHLGRISTLALLRCLANHHFMPVDLHLSSNCFNGEAEVPSLSRLQKQKTKIFSRASDVVGTRTGTSMSVDERPERRKYRKSKDRESTTIIIIIFIPFYYLFWRKDLVRKNKQQTCQ